MIDLYRAIMRQRDPYEDGHSERVANLSARLAKELKLSESATEYLRYAAYLHDIGKVAVAESVLNKPKLTKAELIMVQAHVTLGAQVLEQAGVESEIVEGVLCHHENYDGTGYPAKKEGKNIPQIARIIRVADEFDARTSHRPYHRAASFQDAIKGMMETPSKFDPQVFKALKGLDICQPPK